MPSTSARFQDDAAEVRLPTGEVVQRPRAISASGARSLNGRVTYWEHQGTARLVQPDVINDECRLVDPSRR